MSTTIAAEPYAFPLNGGVDPTNTALLVIDMQIDFCAPGGYIERLGIDLGPIRAPIKPIGRVMAAMRAGGFTIVHTRETFQSDLSDAQPHRLFRGADGMGIIPGDEGPLGRCLIEGEPCVIHTGEEPATVTVDDYAHIDALPPRCPDCDAIVRPDVVLFGEIKNPELY